MPSAKSNARLTIRLRANQKRAIEEAAVVMGQSVSEFAVSTLVQVAGRVLHERNVTVLSQRDRELFMALIDDSDAKPNRALVDAARRYEARRDS